MKRNKLLYPLLVAGISGILLTACGSGQNTSTDSTGAIQSDSNMMMSDTSSIRDTAPAAEQPPGAINPGEDSSRYGTGTGDSSKDRRNGK
ncbi:hypothetical protein F0L74_19735 [Chitinophaga agrisoli]|uniref:Lipoprotein n=1 Tax=Chitinophaga agrisoli TaxID=2607653 RepID=A0A5B2VH61_9BACT|nr:hypothetical protein [Chitinophaga agrisoli]KAA2238461.1 hypothetical protein F0L74_19735 [Chitinophaga agrisoli]